MVYLSKIFIRIKCVITFLSFCTHNKCTQHSVGPVTYTHNREEITLKKFYKGKVIYHT